MSLAAEYDRWHAHVFDSAPEHHDESSPWYELVQEYLGPVRGKRILEVACGRGGFVRLLASQGAKVVGADFSQVALQIAAGKQANGTADNSAALSQADAQQLPFADNSFDAVISCETIEHLAEPAAAVREMARVCRPSGFLYLTTPNYFNLMGLYRVYDKLLKRERVNEETQPHDNYWTFGSIRRLLRGAGWNVLRTDGTVHQVPFPGRSPVRLRFLERNASTRRLLGFAAQHYLAVCSKSAQS